MEKKKSVKKAASPFNDQSAPKLKPKEVAANKAAFKKQNPLKK